MEESEDEDGQEEEEPKFSGMKQPVTIETCDSRWVHGQLLLLLLLFVCDFVCFVLGRDLNCRGKQTRDEIFSDWDDCSCLFVNVN